MDFLLLLIIVLVVLAIFGGIFVHPLLFVLIILALILFASRGRGRVV